MYNKLLMVIMFSYLTSLSAFGAEWLVGWADTGGKNKSIAISDDQEYPFKVGRFNCKASKITLEKIYGEVFEHRYVSCQMSKDTYVSTDLSYNIKSSTCMDTRSLTIYDKDNIYIASLFVKCK
jgi:hypothetical protein